MDRHKSIIWVTISAILFVLNIFLLIYIEEKNKINNKLQVACKVEIKEKKAIKSATEKLIKFQSKKVFFDNDSLSALLQRKGSLPMLVIDKNVCGACLDVLLMELEYFKEDSLSIVDNLNIVLLSDMPTTSLTGIGSVFKDSNLSLFCIESNKFNISSCKKLPSMYFMLINRKKEILWFLEFSESYPAIFSFGFKKINDNYENVQCNIDPNSCSE